MVEPTNIIKNIANHFGTSAVIAGGAIRDITLGFTPKDYDVFFFDEKHFMKAVEKRGVFDEDPTQKFFRSGAYCTINLTVFDTALQGKPVQLILRNDFLGSAQSLYSLTKNYQNNCENVIRGFDYTINMLFYNYLYNKIFISEQAQQAISKREIIFNDNYLSLFKKEIRTVNILTKRMIYSAEKEIRTVNILTKLMIYLAEKLNYIIPLSTIVAIFEKYSEIYNQQTEYEIEW